jgi:hypothetical protein
MRTGTTRRGQGRTRELVLHVAFELDDFHWTLTMGTSPCGNRRYRGQYTVHSSKGELARALVQHL